MLICSNTTSSNHKYNWNFCASTRGETPMKTRFALLLLAATLATATAWAKPNILPDACGKDEIKFDVDTAKDAPMPGAPAEGKAQIILIETFNRPSAWTGVHVSDYAVRFGLDGTWIGATKSNSYFAIDVAPGDHHLCSSVRGSKDLIGTSTFNAEAGKIYYFEYKINPGISRGNASVIGSGGSASGSTVSISISGGFSQLDQDAGSFRVKASALATSKPKD
jgi:hypothetical protein